MNWFKKKTNPVVATPTVLSTLDKIERTARPLNIPENF